MSAGNLIRRLGHLIAELRRGRLDEREREYLDAVLSHYHHTVREWRTTNE